MRCWGYLMHDMNEHLRAWCCCRYDTNTRKYFDPCVRLHLDSRRSKVVRRCYGAWRDVVVRHNLEVRPCCPSMTLSEYM